MLAVLHRAIYIRPVNRGRPFSIKCMGLSQGKKVKNLFLVLVVQSLVVFYVGLLKQR